MGEIQLPPTRQFAQLSSLVNQEPSVTIPVVITFEIQDGIEGLIHSTSVNPGEIEIPEGGDGLFKIVPQPQVGKDSGGVPLIFDMFMQLDTGSGFIDIPRSNVKLTVKDKDITDVIVVMDDIVLKKGDKIRIMQRISGTGVGLGLKATAAEVGPPTIPATPSVIFSMARIES